MADRKSKYDVFISYTASDRNYAERIEALLKDNGINIFYDVWDLKPGEMWSNTLIGVIQNCQCVLILIGKDSFSKRGWCRYTRESPHGDGNSLSVKRSCFPILIATSWRGSSLISCGISTLEIRTGIWTYRNRSRLAGFSTSTNHD